MKFVRLRCGEIAAKSEFDTVRGGFKSIDWNQTDYEHHQGQCLLCKTVSFCNIEHVFWNCMLWCGEIRTKIWRLEYRKHQRKCKKCARHILFRKLRTLQDLATTNFHILEKECVHKNTTILRGLDTASQIKRKQKVVLFGQLTGYFSNGRLQYDSNTSFPDMPNGHLPSFELETLYDNRLHDVELQIFALTDLKHDSPQLAFRFQKGVWDAFYDVFSHVKRVEYNIRIQTNQLTNSCLTIVQSYSYLDSVEIMLLIFDFLQRHIWQRNIASSLNNACRNFIEQYE